MALGIRFSSFRNWFLGLIALFLVLFFARLAYGYYYPAGQAAGETVLGLENPSTSSKRNYASEKTAVEVQAASVDQTIKYEKIATIKARSAHFEEEEKAIKDKIKEFNAVIQFEDNSGAEGRRVLRMLIGVHPNRFDGFYEAAQKVGKLLGKQVTKTDKTNEFLELQAKKNTLEKVRNSLTELKSKSGKIEEYIGLVNRILEVEEQLQGLGVSLGDFDEVNQFCTVNFTLQEGAEVRISFAQRVKTAFEWTVQYYFLLTAGLFFAALAAAVIVWIIVKARTEGTE